MEHLWKRGKMTIPTLMTILIAGVSAGLFALTHLVDIGPRARGAGPILSLLFRGDPMTALYVLTAVAQSLAATLGIVITAVFIVVQLNANRYTPKILDLFVKDIPNLSLLTFFIVSIIYSLWVVTTVTPTYAPHAGVLVSMILMTVCFLSLIPYLIYILNFLKPPRILRMIATEAEQNILRVNDPDADVEDLQKSVASSIDQISDVATSSVQVSDVEVAMNSIIQLKEIIVMYLGIKSHENTRWFDFPESLLLGFSHSSHRDFKEKKTWLEAKVLSQYALIAEMALNKIKDVMSALFACTQEIGTAAARARDAQLVELVVRYFNTYLRIAINKGDKAAVYHMFYQYRLMAQAVMDVFPEEIEKITTHMGYYGTLAEDNRLWFILETAAHDMNTLNQYACEKNLKNTGAILDIFLGLLPAVQDPRRQRALPGLLKSYAILGCFYLWKGNARLARRVAESFRGIPADLCGQIERQLAAVTTPDFWEVTDRGVNFDYMRDEPRKKLPEFFALIPPSPRPSAGRKR